MVRVSALFALAALAATLSACEVRRDGAGDAAQDTAPSPTPAQTGTETPEPVQTATPGASIMREDLAPTPVMDLPPEPLEVTVPFGAGGTDLSEQAERVLAGVLESEQIEEGWPIILRGHTDSAGNDSANLRASRARAEAVAAWMVERGVADRRIEVIAFGEQNPVAPNALPDGTPNERGRAQNKRVVVSIGPPADESEEEAGENAADSDEDETSAGGDGGETA